MATNLQYGDITIQNCQTERFEQSCRYDETGTDLIYHEFNIDVSGIVALGASGGFHGVNVSGADATEIMRDVHAKMMHPRQEFIYSVGGTTLLAASPDVQYTNRDVNNGPKPQSCNITHIAGNKVYRIRFSIQVCIVLCVGEHKDYLTGQTVTVPFSSSPILNNRWSLIDTKDENLYTTRTWTGILRVAHTAVNPNWLRHMCLPHQTKGFRRQRMNWTATPDGLSLKYEITDKQEYQAPPHPATTMRGTYTESVGAGGKLGHARVNVELQGPPDAAKDDLYVRCVQICLDRIGTFTETMPAGNQPVLLSAQLTEYLGECRVSLSVEFLRAPNTAGQPGLVPQRYWNAVTTTIGTPFRMTGYDPKQFIKPSPYDGSSPAGVFVMYLQSPCNDWHGMAHAAPIPAEETTPVQGYDDNHQPTQYFGVSEDLQQDPLIERYSEAHATWPYTFYQLSNRYIINHGKTQLAIADDDAALTDPSAVVVKLHRPMATRLLHVTAERVGQWPEVPKPVDLSDPNDIPETVLSEDILVHDKELMQDGKNYKYRLEIEYVFALSRAPTATEKLRAGSDPADTTRPADSFYPLNLRTEGNIE